MGEASCWEEDDALDASPSELGEDESDDDGNAVVYKGSSDLKFYADKVTVKATIKAHDTRDGVKQTIISRPKIID